MSRDLGKPVEQPPPSRGEHVATLSYNGRFWDVFMEVENDPRRGGLVRALLCFSPSDLNAGPEYRRHLARVLVRRALEQAEV